MAKCTVKTKNCQLIIRVKLSLQEKLNERQFDFYSGKCIRGLLKAKLIRKNVIEYYGPIGISLYERLKKTISKYEFLFIMEQIVDIVQKLNANSLIISNMLFDIKNVYINETTKEIQFIYLPLEKSKADIDIFSFMENIIYSANPMPEDDMEYISRYVYFIKGMGSFSTDKLEKFILGEDRSIVNTIKSHNVGQSGFMTDKQADYYAHYHKEDPEATGYLNEAADNLDMDNPTGLLDDLSATGILTDAEETGLLNDNGSQFGYATLYRCLTKEVIKINKLVFRIGKEKSYCDYYVGDNDKVSRSHADIITRGKHFFVIDLNSKNRTCINGIPVTAGQEVEIFNGDRLKFANEEFEFRI